MARELERLTATRVRRAIAGKPDKLCDGGGLWLHVTNDGAYWFFRYGKKAISLGPTHTRTLADARARAQACRLLLADGRDPKVERETIRAAAQVEAAKRVTTTQAIDAFHANHRGKWRSEKHAKEWRTSLRT